MGRGTYRFFASVIKSLITHLSRQILALARALVRKSKILLLDEGEEPMFIHYSRIVDRVLTTEQQLLPSVSDFVI